MTETKDHPAVKALQAKFPDVDFGAGSLMERPDGPGDQICVHVGPDRLIEVMTFLKEDEATRFEQLIDVTCVDYLNFRGATDRFGVVYALLSLTLGHRFWVKVAANEPDPVVPSVTRVWKGANWPEREVYDMFGIRFEGHPDLRRILTWEGCEPHPLRKDYPLRGRGEREDQPVMTRDAV